MHKYLLTVCIFFVAAVLFIPAANGSDQVSSLRSQTLVFCKVSNKPNKHIKQLQPILDYAVSRLGHVGITRGRVIFARDNRQMLNYIKQGKVDWITETPFSAALFEQKAGAEMLLLRWKKGVPTYHTLFVARKGSGITGLQDLQGKILAVEDRGSTSGFLLPVSTMIQNNLKVTELASPREAVPDDMAGFVFSREEVNISTMVFRGIVDAGAFSNLDWEDEDRVNEQVRKELTVIHKTAEVPRALELVRGDLDQEVKEALKNLLLHASEDPGAEAALKAYKKTSKFEDIDSEVAESLKSVRELADIIQAEIM